MRYRLLLAFLALVCHSCKPPTLNPPAVGMYHWQTHLNLSLAENDYLNGIQAQRLYIKYFDVDWDVTRTQPVPLAILEKRKDLPAHLDIVPCVFITNRTMLHLSAEAIDDLAFRIHRKIHEIHSDFPKNAIAEVQIDCDWTNQSRDRYFALLEALRQKFRQTQTPLSATIRLHQVKYFEKTGVPPVDRGVLMFYNMGDLDAPQTQNSILDLDTAQAYLSNFDVYPLPLDVALPIFAWGVLRRGGKTIKLIHGLETSHLDRSKFTALDATHFEVRQSTFLDGHYLYEGDRIRIEKVTPQLLVEAVQLLRPHIQPTIAHLIFYHLDTTTIQHFDTLFVKNLWNIPSR